jgi:hypothetical protein
VGTNGSYFLQILLLILRPEWLEWATRHQAEWIEPEQDPTTALDGILDWHFVDFDANPPSAVWHAYFATVRQKGRVEGGVDKGLVDKVWLEQVRLTR